MAWQEDMVMMLRIVINDFADTPNFSDARLIQLLSVSAQLVNQEIKFGTTYTINVGSYSIEPDPTLTATKDDLFTNFVVLRAACLSDLGNARTKAIISGLSIKCGQMAINTNDYSAAFQKLISEGPCSAYKELKKEYQFGGGVACFAILSPFIGNRFDPECQLPYYGNDYNNRDRY